MVDSDGRAGSTGSGGVAGSSGDAGSGGDAGSAGVVGTDASAAGGAGGGSGAGTGGRDASTDSLCIAARVPLTPRILPVDLIWAVDTSGSMVEEAAAIQETVNSVVQTIFSAGIDAHTVMLASPPLCIFDSGTCLPGICVPPPLGSGRCPDDSKPPNYFHHPSAVVNSNDAARVLVERFADYRGMLRASSQKHLFVVTDDDVTGTQAGVYADNPARFIADYTALDPMLADSASGGRVWRLSGMYAASACPNATRVGQVWKTIIDQTGGVHADICACPAGQPQSCSQAVRAWSDAVAKSIVRDSQLAACEWTIPPLPVGQRLDVDGVSAELTDAISGARITFLRVANAAACGPIGGFYFDDPANPTTIFVCPASCGTVKAMPDPGVSILVRCRQP